MTDSGDGGEGGGDELPCASVHKTTQYRINNNILTCCTDDNEVTRSVLDGVRFIFFLYSVSYVTYCY